MQARSSDGGLRSLNAQLRSTSAQVHLDHDFGVSITYLGECTELWNMSTE